MKTDPIVIEQTYNAPVERVWAAITDLEKMQQWYFPTLAEFEPKVGFETRFDVLHDGKTFPEHIWKVTEVVPGKKISYEWKFGGYPGVSLLTMELFDAEGKTRVVLTHAGLETHEGDKHPDFAISNFVRGWTYFTNTSLKDYLEKENYVQKPIQHQ